MDPSSECRKSGSFVLLLDGAVVSCCHDLKLRLREGVEREEEERSRGISRRDERRYTLRCEGEREATGALRIG